MIMYQKTMFDPYYYITYFCHLKTLGNASKRSFLCYYNSAQKHEGFLGFENAYSRGKTYVILTSLNNVRFYARSVDAVNLCDCIYCWK